MECAQRVRMVGKDGRKSAEDGLGAALLSGGIREDGEAGSGLKRQISDFYR